MRSSVLVPVVPVVRGVRGVRVLAVLVVLVAAGFNAPVGAQKKAQDAPSRAAEVVQPAVGELNPLVLEVLATYPTDGSHRYYWPRQKKVTWAGNARDMEYRGKMLAKGDPEHRSFCCGLTFEVWFFAYAKWCENRKVPFVIAGFDGIPELVALRRQWFGSDGDRRCSDHALADNRIGRRIAKFDDARPGDFVQFWRHGGSGHSAIFTAWVRKDEKIVGLRYWSTQKATAGIGYREEFFGKRKGVDRKQVHITRAGVEPKKPQAAGGPKRGAK